MITAASFTSFAWATPPSPCRTRAFRGRHGPPRAGPRRGTPRPEMPSLIPPAVVAESCHPERKNAGAPWEYVKYHHSQPVRSRLATGKAMSSEGSITRWVTALKGGDTAAAQPLWERYYRQLVALARQKLQAARRREADEEDVGQNPFHSFFQGLAGGRFPQLHDRDNLWRLLVVITARKALDQLAHQHSKRQGGGTVQGESRIYSGEPGWDEAALEQVVGDEPTPE